jgi:AraC family transcriptional regulator, regulatory protein of adaptative response / methylated-DNA-[protein]-cysteine methyltransferase
MKTRATPQRRDWDQVVLAACRLIERAAEGERLATGLGRLGVSLPELRRQFRARLGTTPRDYGQALRLARLARQASQEPSALAAALAAGFTSATRAYAVAKPALGVTPGELRRAMAIGWWLGLSELGWMLMAATPGGICWLAFGSAPQALLTELGDAFPRARWIDDSARLRDWFERVRTTILLPEAALDLPLDVRGTAFQARVWSALRRIPLGETRSYGDVARTVGRPSAVRAVARACGANRIALLIPCHRVIAADGALSGYRWGTTRKRRLLDRERRAGAPADAQMATSSAGSRRL